MISNWKILLAHKILTLCKYIFTISSSLTQQQLTYPPCASHTFSSALLSSAGLVLPPRNLLMKTKSSVKTRCTLLSPLHRSPFALSVCLHLHILTSRLLSRSPSLVCGVYTLAGLVFALVTACVCVCVCEWLCVS